MARYKIMRICAHNGVSPNKEFFEVNEKKCVADFSGGSFVTSDEDVAEFYRHRNFPNSIPNGDAPLYDVCEIE